MQNYILNFITDEQWKYMLKIDILTNKRLKTRLYNSIKKLEEKKYNDILSELERFKKYSYDTLNKALKEKNITKKYMLDREAYAYYGYVECITEGSILTNFLYEELKNDLDTLSKIDKISPSKLTNFNKLDEDIDLNNEHVKLYLLMKKWQDEQHIYHEEYLIKHHNNIKNEFISYLNENKPYIKSKSLLKKYYLNYLDDKTILSMKELKEAYQILGDELANIVGGKNLGLTKLYSLGIKTRRFYALTIGSLLTNNYDISKIKNRVYSVRSSATVEDNKNQSFAGMFKSILNVDYNNLENAIHEVYLSNNSNRVKEYVKHFKTDTPFMSIVIQEFDEPDYSGIWIGTNTLSGNIEIVTGNGEKLVSGHVIPLKNSTWEKKIIKKCINLQNKFNSIADFEFCVCNNILYFVQYRPVTKIINQDKVVIQNSDIKGTAASCGEVSGISLYLENFDDNFDKDILLADYTDPNWVPIMIKAKGIITAEGGFLSHASIISRELGIPCITGIGEDNMERLKQNSHIKMNGGTGDIIIL